MQTLAFTRWMLFLLILLCVSHMPVTQARSPTLPALFVPISSHGAATRTSNAYQVMINPALLLPTDRAFVQHLRLDLPGHVGIITAVRDRVVRNPSGSYSWFGHVEEVAHSVVVLTTHHGLVQGSIILPGATYGVRPLHDALHLIEEWSSLRFVEEQPIVDQTVNNDVANANAIPIIEDGSRIDLLVVYTPAARVHAGGVDKVKLLIEDGVSMANEAYGLSGVTHRLRLIHMAEVAYTEPATMADALDDLKNNRVPDVHALRDWHTADLVALVTQAPPGQTCDGMAQQGGYGGFRPTDAFSVLQFDECRSLIVSLPHEIGHLLGAAHEWYVDDRAPFTYGHGYVNCEKGWATLMAYGVECFGSGNFQGRLPYFSNPDLTFEGTRLGVPVGTSTACTKNTPSHPPCDADNRRLLNESAIYVANYRVPTTTLLPTLSVTADTAQGGAQLHYTVHIQNGGEVAAGLVHIESAIPPQTQVETGSLSTDAVLGRDAISWSLHTNLAPGARETRTFTLLVDPGVADATKIINNVVTQAYNAPTVASAASVVELLAPKLIASLTSAPNPVLATDTLITYTLTLQNAGRRHATNVQMYNEIPVQTTYISGSASDNGTYEEALTWPAVTVMAGASIQRTFQVEANTLLHQGLLLTNRLTITATEQSLTRQTLITIVEPQQVYLPYTAHD